MSTHQVHDAVTFGNCCISCYTIIFWTSFIYSPFLFLVFYFSFFSNFIGWHKPTVFLIKLFERFSFTLFLILFENVIYVELFAILQNQDIRVLIFLHKLYCLIIICLLNSGNSQFVEVHIPSLFVGNWRTGESLFYTQDYSSGLCSIFHSLYCICCMSSWYEVL